MDNTGTKLGNSMGWEDVKRLRPRADDYAEIMNGPMERPKPVTGSANRQAYAPHERRAAPDELLPYEEEIRRYFSR